MLKVPFGRSPFRGLAAGIHVKMESDDKDDAKLAKRKKRGGGKRRWGRIAYFCMTVLHHGHASY